MADTGTMAMVIVMDTNIIMAMEAMVIMAFTVTRQEKILIFLLKPITPILIKKRKVSGPGYGEVNR